MTFPKDAKVHIKEKITFSSNHAGKLDVYMGELKDILISHHADAPNASKVSTQNLKL